MPNHHPTKHYLPVFMWVSIVIAVFSCSALVFVWIKQTNRIQQPNQTTNLRSFIKSMTVEGELISVNSDSIGIKARNTTEVLELSVPAYARIMSKEKVDTSTLQAGIVVSLVPVGEQSTTLKSITILPSVSIDVRTDRPLPNTKNPRQLYTIVEASQSQLTLKTQQGELVTRVLNEATNVSKIRYIAMNELKPTSQASVTYTQSPSGQKIAKQITVLADK